MACQNGRVYAIQFHKFWFTILSFIYCQQYPTYQFHVASHECSRILA